MSKTPADQHPQAPFEFVATTVFDKTTSIVAKDSEGAFVMVKMLMASDDVKSFRVFARNGILTPASLNQDPANYSKWSK